MEDEHGRQLSYAALVRGADRVATRLARWGAGRGDRVGLWLPKGLEAVTAVHGILRRARPMCRSTRRARPSRAARHPGRQRRQGGGRRRRAGAGSPRGMARRGPLPRLIVVEGTPERPPRLPSPAAEAGSIPIAPGDASWAEVIADDAPSPLLPQPRDRRPGVHPVHLGLDRPAQGRDALARQRLHVPGLVPAGAGSLGGRRPVRLARSLAFRPVGVRPVRFLPTTRRRWC